jgi:hypothetical protein
MTEPTQDTKHVLIIYETVPEDSRVYDLDVTYAELARMLRCHGALSNTTGNSKELEDDLDWLNQFLGPKDPVMSSAGKCPLHAGGVYDAIILTGFYL